VYGGVPAQSADCITAGSFSYRILSRRGRRERVFGGCYGGGLSMLLSESSLKIPPCSFVDFLVLEGGCWLGRKIGESKNRLLLRRRRRCYLRKREKESPTTSRTDVVPFA
jgi:hypothetical protein